MSDTRRFFRRFLSAPIRVGAIAPSSPALAREVLAPIDFNRVDVVVEFGPGTGAFTAGILQRLRAQGRYIGIERDVLFCRHLRERFPGIDVHHGDVADLPAILDTRGITTVDAVVSGLPWATLPIALQSHIFDAMGSRLAVSGTFVTFGYVSGLVLPGAVALRSELRRRFAEVRRTRIVWNNLPPAMAHVCRGNRARH